MKCPNCGADNADNAAFCFNCGTKLSAQNSAPAQEDTKPQYHPEPTVQSTKTDSSNGFIEFLKANKKLAAISGGVVVALILVVGVIASLSGGSSLSGSYLYNLEITPNIMRDNGELQVMVNGKFIGDPIDIENGYFVSSPDGSSLILLTYDDEYDYDAAYFVTDKELKKIADDVIGATISDNGKVAAIVTDDYMLYTVNLPSCKMTKVRLGDEDTKYGIVMSPNGKNLLYKTDDELWFHKSGAEDYMIAKDYSAIAVSDNGKYIYIRNDETSGIYVTKANDQEKTKISSSGGYGCLLNHNRTEIVFVTDDDDAYISIKGGDRVKLGSFDWVTPIYPDNYTAVSTFIGIPMQYETSEDSGLFYITKDLETEKIAKNIDSYYYSDYTYSVSNTIIYPTLQKIVGDTIYYTKSGKLYKSTASGGYEPVKLTSDTVQNFAVTGDGKRVYYIDEENTLWCSANGKDPKKIADDVYTFYLGTFGNQVFFLTDYSDYAGTLYRCSDGKTKTRVADDVFNVEYGNSCIIYLVIEDRDDVAFSYYSSTDGNKFKCVIDDYHIDLYN